MKHGPNDEKGVRNGWVADLDDNRIAKSAIVACRSA